MDLDAIELPAQREVRLKVRRGGHCTVMFGRRTARQVQLADSSHSATDLKTLALSCLLAVLWIFDDKGLCQGSA